MSKGITKKNEEKLRLYLSKQNDTTTSTQANRTNSNQPQNGKELQSWTSTRLPNR